jgi:hypothetical protein
MGNSTLPVEDHHLHDRVVVVHGILHDKPAKRVFSEKRPQRRKKAVARSHTTGNVVCQRREAIAAAPSQNFSLT